MPDQPDKTIPPPNAVPLEPGATLGPFHLLSLLGEGGMGKVFLADDTKLGRKVALKVMRPDLAKDERARKMFLREARSAASIGHDRIVTVYDANEADGVPYIAMELLAGEPLNQYLERNPTPSLPVALTIAYQVAEGLWVAHEKGLIHRDIKPANVWLRTTPGRKGIDVRLLDFGLARAAAGDTLSTGGAGKALGTPLYMAPEQWDGKDVDHQSDLFSLGVMLYQMLTGRPPFAGVSVKELMFQICMPHVTPEPPATLDPTIPAALSAFVLRMIAKDKGQRVRAADEVMRELARLKKSAGGSTAVPVAKPVPPPRVADTTPVHGPFEATRKPLPRPIPKRSRGPVWLMVAGGVLFAAVVLAVILLLDGPSNRGTARKDNPSPPTTEPASVPPTRKQEPPPPTQKGAGIPDPPLTKKGSDPLPPKVRPSPLNCTGPNGASEAEVKRSQQEWAAYLGVEVEIHVELGGGVGIDFVLVPPGQYLMGTTEPELDELVKAFPKFSKDSYKDEMPQHTVTIPKPLFVGKTEVTRGQFRRFAASGYESEAERTDGGWGWDAVKKEIVGRNKKYSWKETGWPADDSHPAVNVTWNDATAFAAWLKGPAGFRTARLPTEAEWEYACRAGTRSRYPNGSDDPKTLVTFANVLDASGLKVFPTLKEYALDADDGFEFTAPVGSPKFRPNRFGLFDTIGNVWEWCEDGYDAEAYKKQDQFGRLDKQSNDSRVLRGSSWVNNPWYARPANRNRNDATNRNNNNGFRVILPQATGRRRPEDDSLRTAAECCRSPSRCPGRLAVRVRRINNPFARVSSVREPHGRSRSAEL